MDQGHSGKVLGSGRRVSPSGGVSHELGHGGSRGGDSGGVPGTVRRRVCKSCGRFADEHGRRRHNGACSCFIYSHSIILTWRAVHELYQTKGTPNPRLDRVVNPLTGHERSLIRFNDGESKQD